MPNSPITIVGVSARAAAQAARRAGFSPYSIDLFADCDTQAAGPACRIDGFPQHGLTALRNAPDSPWMYTGGLENYPDLVEELAALRPLLGNRADVLRGVRDPIQLSQAVVAAGFRYPSVDANASEDRIFKPRRSGGGRGVLLVPGNDRRRPARGWHEQRYINGKAASALFVAAAGSCRTLGTSLQLIGQDFGFAERFCYVGSIAPLVCSDSVAAEIDGIGCTLAKRFDLQGVFGIDIILRGEEVWLLEVNPRLTASAEAVERASGLNPVAAHIASCSAHEILGHWGKSSNESRELHGKCIVFARGKCLAGDRLSGLVTAWNEAEQPQIADLPHIGSHFAAGEPVATVFASGAAEVEVIRSLEQRMEEVLSAMDPE